MRGYGERVRCEGTVRGYGGGGYGGAGYGEGGYGNNLLFYFK